MPMPIFSISLRSVAHSPSEESPRKAKQWFYANKEVVSTWEKCSNAFLTKFFPLSKTNALQNNILSFQQLTDKTIAEA
jgi:hypothetical protein